MASKPKQITAIVERLGEKIVLPTNARTRDVANYLMQLAEQEDTWVNVDGLIEGYLPYDVGYAFSEALKETFGFTLSQAKTVNSFFGTFTIPPQTISVQTGLNEQTQVVWGEFALPGIEGHVEISVLRRSGGIYPVRISAEVRQKDRHYIDDIIKATKTYLKNHSIYQGKAFELTLHNDEGEIIEMPEPKFFDTSRTLVPIFNREIEVQIGASIYSPICRTAEMRASNIDLKRGVCLYGPFGTGKTQTSRRVAELAIQNNWTFIKVSNPIEFADILKIARNFQPCVVFCEDIDRVTAGQRTIKLDEILNNLDGIDAKGTEIIVVVTTNEFEDINRAMLRPGRLDASIKIGYPDNDAAERLIRMYSGELLSPDEDISKCCNLMANKIPAASVAEVIRRAKLFVLEQRRVEDVPVDPTFTMMLDGESLAHAAVEVVTEFEFIQDRKHIKRDTSGLSAAEKAAYIYADALNEIAEKNGSLPVIDQLPSHLDNKHLAS